MVNRQRDHIHAPVANHVIFNPTQKYGGSGLLIVMDIDLNDKFTLALRTITGMYFIIS